MVDTQLANGRHANGRLHLSHVSEFHLNSECARELFLVPLLLFYTYADGRHFYHVAEEHLLVWQMVEVIYHLQAKVVTY